MKRHGFLDPLSDFLENKRREKYTSHEWVDFYNHYVQDDSDIAEEIVFGTLKNHNMEQCREMLRNTPFFKENDILINDRGFLSRETTNYLKNIRKVATHRSKKP